MTTQPRWCKPLQELFDLASNMHSKTVPEVAQIADSIQSLLASQPKQERNTQTRTLARIRIDAIPDGTGVHTEESVGVEITWPTGFDPTPKDKNYTVHGGWRLLEPIPQPTEGGANG